MIALIAAGLLLLFVVFELSWIKFYGSPVSRPDISRSALVYGDGPSLTYVVLGDSTAVAQGAAYNQGYAVATAQHLAQTHKVNLINLAVSGARAKDVANLQVPQAVGYHPDVVLIAVGANDVTHLTGKKAVQASLQKSIAALQEANSNVRIVLTGSPDMGAPTRIPQPLRWAAGERTISTNKVIASLADGKRIFFAPIAKQTGPTFRRHHDLFAADHFHPTAAGYALWVPVLNPVLDQALPATP